MRVACWAWIVVSTTLILFWSPVSVTRQADKSRPQVTSIEWIGPFGEPFRSHRQDITKSSIDFSRMIAALLAANFLPAVLLWRHDKVAGWLERQQRHPVTSDQAPGNEMLTRERARREALERRDAIAIFTCLLILLLVGVGTIIIYKQAYRVPPTRSSPNEQSTVSGASPSPAPPPEPAGTPLSPSPVSPYFSSTWVDVYEPGGGRIKSKSDNGEITLEDGSVWRVYPPDRIKTASWTRMTYLGVVNSEVRSRDRGYLLINATEEEQAYAEWLLGPPPK
jgi:hypothetical protein